MCRYLHSQGLVHRDLKTENLLFTADGTIKLADFGEAVRLGRGGTVRGEIGTYRWMAPEVSAAQHHRNPLTNEVSGKHEVAENKIARRCPHRRG